MYVLGVHSPEFNDGYGTRRDGSKTTHTHHAKRHAFRRHWKIVIACVSVPRTTCVDYLILLQRIFRFHSCSSSSWRESRPNPRAPTHKNRFSIRRLLKLVYSSNQSRHLQNKNLDQAGDRTQTYVCCSGRPFSSAPPVRNKRRQEPMAQHKTLAFFQYLFCVLGVTTTRHGCNHFPTNSYETVCTIPHPKVQPFHANCNTP